MSARVLFERRCQLRRRRLAAACLFAGTSPLAFREEAKTSHRAHGDTESTEKRGKEVKDEFGRRVFSVPSVCSVPGLPRPLARGGIRSFLARAGAGAGNMVSHGRPETAANLRAPGEP